jgi:hypothetical protein
MRPRPDAVNWAWRIEAYDKDGDGFVAERELPQLDVATVRELWQLAPDDPIAGMLPITELEVSFLAQLVGRRLDLTRFAYFVSCVSDNGGVIRDQGPIFYTAPRMLPAFPAAVRVRPKTAAAARRRAR